MEIQSPVRFGQSDIEQIDISRALVLFVQFPENVRSRFKRKNGSIGKKFADVINRLTRVGADVEKHNRVIFAKKTEQYIVQPRMQNRQFRIDKRNPPKHLQQRHVRII